MKYLITLILFICLLLPNCYALLSPRGKPSFNSTSITYHFDKDGNYITKWIFYKDEGITETGFTAPFDCSVTNSTHRFCTHHSPDNFKNFITSDYATYCEVTIDGTLVGCDSYVTGRMIDGMPFIFPASFDSRPPTSGGSVWIRGYLLRFITTMSYVLLKPGGLIRVNEFAQDFDANHFELKIPAGSGTQQIYTYYGFDNYPIPLLYAAPNVTTFTYDKSKSLITLDGNNYATDTSKIGISINGVVILQSNMALKVNHHKIEISNQVVNYGEYASQVKVAIIVDSVPMDESYAYCYKPIPTSINSVSKHLGGIITITGSYMPAPGSNNLTIMLGNDTCKLIRSIQGIIECSLEAVSDIPETTQLNELQVSIQIGNSSISGGCKNDNILKYTYGIPTLSSAASVVQSGRLITIIGTNLANISETVVIITGQGGDIEIIPKSITDGETKLIFELPSLKCDGVTLYVKNKRVPAQSSSITFKVDTFEIEANSTPLVNNGTGLILNLLYITCPLSVSAAAPIATVGSSPSLPCSTPTIDTISNGNFYSTKCNVPPGTGKGRPISLKYNSKSAATTYSYAAPKIDRYVITDTNITIIGLNFGTSNSLLNSNYSSRTIVLIGNVTDSKFIFSRNESDINSNITITVDGVVGDPYSIKLLPVAHEFLNTTNQLQTSGETIMITGKNFESSKDDNSDYKIQIIANALVQTHYEVVNDNIIIVFIPRLNSTFCELSFSVGGHQQIQNANFKFIAANIESVSKIHISLGKVVSFEIIGNNFRDDHQVSIPGIDEGKLVFTCELVYHNLTNNVEKDKLVCSSTLSVDSLSIESNTLALNFGEDIKLETTIQYEIEEASSANRVFSHLLPTVSICLLFSLLFL